jgi:hypothetical protein
MRTDQGKTNMILYRPVGLSELELIAKSGFRTFPPRLPGQPIFYPVLNMEYAVQIARDWNTKDAASGHVGFVTRFEVRDEYVKRFEEHVVGRRDVHRELWVLSEQLPEFNSKIVGLISVEAAFYGSSFGGAIDSETNLPQGPISDGFRIVLPGSRVKGVSNGDGD